jgi:hypothetical protein
MAEPGAVRAVADNGLLWAVVAGCVEVRICGVLWRRRWRPSLRYRGHSVGDGRPDRAAGAPLRPQVDGGRRVGLVWRRGTGGVVDGMGIGGTVDDMGKKGSHDA